MKHDIIRRADLERELLKEYSQVVSNRAKHPEEMGYSWQVEELDKILKIAKKIPAISDERIIILPEEIRVGSRVYEIYRFMDEGAWEVDVHRFRLEDIPKMGKMVFTTMENAEKAIKARRNKE